MNRVAIVHGANFDAAASFGNGYIVIDQYQTEIQDLVKRAGFLGRRMPKVPATGPLSRWFEQTAIGAAKFDARQSLTPTATGPTRGERSVLIKAITNRVQFGLFDQQVAGLMPENMRLKAKDTMDMINGIILLNDQALWTGTDVVNGAQIGDGTTNQYVGIPKQITSTSVTVGSTDSIVDAIRLSVAKLVGSATENLLPTAIYMNPLALYALEEEVKQNDGNLIGRVDVEPGVNVTGVMTAAGRLPIFADPLLAVDPTWGDTAPGGQTAYPFVILTESMLEYHYVGSPTPQMFTLGTVSTIIDDYVGVMFGAPVVKAGGSAHVRGTIERLTY